MNFRAAVATTAARLSQSETAGVWTDAPARPSAAASRIHPWRGHDPVTGGPPKGGIRTRLSILLFFLI
jgi:hypothetical protein